MKYDSSMTNFHADIGKAIRHFYTNRQKTIDEMRQDGDPMPLREYLKSSLLLTGSSHHDEPFSVWYSPAGMELKYERVLNNSGDNVLKLSWSQLVTLIRNDGFFRECVTNNVIASQYQQAVQLNLRIIASAQLAQQSLYEMCMGLKEMRDSRLYKELGYSDFGDYCEQETGFRRTQAYCYIAIAEKLPADFVRSSGQIGVKKLELLSRISEEERTEIISSTDLETATVRQLEEQIRRLKVDNENAKKTKQILDEHIITLGKQIKALENRPVETAVQYVERLPDDYITRQAYEEMVSEYTAQLDRADEEHLAEKRRAYAEKQELEKKISELEGLSRNGTDGAEESFELLQVLCRQLLGKLVSFAHQYPEYRLRVKQFLQENADVDKEN